jgi:hypothetical protein
MDLERGRQSEDKKEQFSMITKTVLTGSLLAICGGALVVELGEPAGNYAVMTGMFGIISYLGFDVLGFTDIYLSEDQVTQSGRVYTEDASN